MINQNSTVMKRNCDCYSLRYNKVCSKGQKYTILIVNTIKIADIILERVKLISTSEVIVAKRH